MPPDWAILPALKVASLSISDLRLTVQVLFTLVVQV